MIMGLEAAFEDLNVRMRALYEALAGLHTTVVEDKPGDVVLVDLFGDAAADLLGLLSEARDATERAGRGAPLADLERLRRALIVGQGRYNQIAHRLSSDLLCYERTAELLQFGRRRGGEWWSWAESVKAALDDCREPSYELSLALFRCWQELTERAGALSFSLQPGAYRQSMTIAEREDPAREDVR